MQINPNTKVKSHNITDYNYISLLSTKTQLVKS